MPLLLKHNGAEVDLAATRCELGTLVRSFAAGDQLTLRRAIAFDEPTDWQNEDSIELLLDGVPLFVGRMQASERIASAADGEGIRYTCAGPREAANAIPFRRVIGGVLSPRAVYNCPVEEELPEAGCVALRGTAATVGQIVADILDTMAPALAGVIGDGSPGSGYRQAELNALAAVPPKLALAGESVDEALRSVLHYAPDFGFVIDPATRQARFTDFRSLEARDVRGVGGAVIRQQLAFSTADCFTACTVQGSPEVVDIFETLTPAWNPYLEASWTSEKAAKYPDTYGRVWRLFATAEPAQQGGTIEPERFVGGGGILASVAYTQFGELRASFVTASVVDGTKLLLDAFAREWDANVLAYKAAVVRARFTYRKARVAGRYPAAGHAGTAHTRRGVVREMFLIEEERGRKSIKGTVHQVISPTSFYVLYGLGVETDELADTLIELNGDGVAHTIAANDSATVTLDEPPQTPIQAGDAFVITVQDDTLKCFENGTLSLLEKYAKETLEPVMDERVSGTIPLAGLDWSLRLGQKISFTDTHDPEYATLGAPLVAIEHDLARERTVLILSTERAGGPVAWADLERQRLGDRETAEHRRQLRRLWRRIRRRRTGMLEGPVGDFHELDPDGPYVGDGIWTSVADKKISHIGPGPAYRVIGGTGNYIQWISLDYRGHVVEAGTGTFS